jgi:hypothetical protein
VAYGRLKLMIRASLRRYRRPISCKTLGALLLIAIFPFVAQAEDACKALIPATLEAQLLERFTDYRLPRETDNSAEDIQYARDHSQSACLGVASADFDGDGRLDYLIGLTAKNGDGTFVLVALARDTGWEIHKLDAWKEGRSRLYVSTEPAGTYNSVGDSDGPLEKGEVEKLVCPHEVAVFGATEASGVAYCFVNSRWKHTWISD